MKFSKVRPNVNRVTVVTSNHARSCMSDTPADPSLPRVAVPEAPSCKRIDPAQNHFLTPRASARGGATSDAQESKQRSRSPIVHLSRPLMRWFLLIWINSLIGNRAYRIMRWPKITNGDQHSSATRTQSSKGCHYARSEWS